MQVKNITVGNKYTAKDGQEKTKWTTIGALFIKDDGKMSIKLEQIPLNWDGNAQVFDRDQQNQSHNSGNYQQQGQPQQYPQGYGQPAPQQQQYQAPQQQQAPEYRQEEIPF